MTPSCKGVGIGVFRMGSILRGEMPPQLIFILLLLLFVVDGQPKQIDFIIELRSEGGMALGYFILNLSPQILE